jgi:heme exporter protein B
MGLSARPHLLLLGAILAAALPLAPWAAAAALRQATE